MTPSTSLPRPGPIHGAYPLRLAPPVSVWSDLADRLGDRLTGRGWGQRRQAAQFSAALTAPVSAGTDPAALAAQRLLRDGFAPQHLALAQQAAAGAIEAVFGYRPYATQHQAAYALLQGQLVEMDTGEGKSLAILLAAASAALARVPVHVITANEYLAERDAEAADQVLRRLGLRASAIRNEMKADERRAAYACDVVYATAQEIGFDFLRDRGALQAGEAPVLRGLCLALVDEADSVLLDHAQTPLVLSQHSSEGESMAVTAAAWQHTGTLRGGVDFHLHAAERRIEFNAGALAGLPPALQTLHDQRLQAAALHDALMARHALQRDVHYLVDGDSVVLLDQNTGRKLVGTVWSRGLQQMVHFKEGLPPPQATRTANRITLQTLLGRYLRLAGISGTLRESRGPLWFFYRLPVCRVEPRLPSLRRHQGTRLFTHRRQQLDAVAERARAVAATGRAVLVGTDSVAAADELSAALTARGVAHRLLTARDDAAEAELIAGAGAPGTITVATHIAGRGTDIGLSDAALAAGGLHVICCAQNSSGRIDRQLFGRAARNGRPGSCETMISLDDPVYATLFPVFAISSLRRMTDKHGNVSPLWGACVPALVHALKSWGEFLRSYQLVRHDRLVRDALAFAPHAE